MKTSFISRLISGVTVVFVPLRIHEPPPPVPILSLRNTVHAFPSYVLHIHFHIVLPSTPRCYKWPFPLRHPHQIPLNISPGTHTSHISLPGSKKIFRVGSYVLCSFSIRVILQKTLSLYAVL